MKIKDMDMTKATVTVYRNDKVRLNELVKVIGWKPEDIFAQAVYDYVQKNAPEVMKDFYGVGK